MRLAYVTATEKGRTDLVLAEAAELLRTRGLRLAGVVQTNIRRPRRFRCDMDLRLLPDGPKMNITQDLGANAHGCHLDPDALERAVAEIASRLRRRDIDALVLNKFGKHEAAGRGFREVIAQALGLGLPVLLGVNRINLDAFLAFSCGIAEELPCDAAALAGWFDHRLAVAV